MATSNEMGQAAYKEANPQVSGELIQAAEKSEQAARPVAAPAREENPKAITTPKTIDETTTILSDAMNTTHAIKGGTLTQRISQLGKTGGLEYPEYRTLSQQQRVAYLEAMSNPDYQRMARRSIQEDLERTSNISAQTKNTMTRWAADLLSFDNTEMWFGNMIATDDYADVAEMGLNVAAGATGIAATAAVGIFTPTGIAEEEPFIMGIPYSEYRDLSKEQFAEKYKEFERLDEALAKQEEIKSNVPQKKERTLGQKMVGAALRDIEYKNAVLPQGLPADAESIYTKILGGATSFGEYMAGAVAGRAIGKVGANISTKTRTSTAAAQRFKDITGKDTKLKTGLVAPSVAAKERYAGMIGGQVGSKAATTLMVNDVLGSGAHESIRQYIEETGDTTLENYTGDIKKFSIDVANAAVQSWIENKWGISKFIKNPRLATKYGEWVNGFIQEFSQGEISDIAEIIKGNKTLQEALENIANNAIEGGVGSLLQGTVGTSYYMYYHKKTVSELRDIVMKQNPNLSFAQAEEFAERKTNELEEGLVQDMVKDIVDFTDTNNYQGRIYETVRNNITQAIDAQRERMKDTIDGSKFDEMTEQERATYIGQVAADETDRIVVQALDEGIALSDVPQLKGQVIDGTYYLEGADYAKRTAAQLEAERQQLRDAVFAKRQADKEAKAAATEARKAASWAEKTANMIADAKEKAEAARVKKETAQQIKESDARIKELQAEETKWQKQVEKWEKEYAKTQEKSEAAIQKDIERQTKAAIAGGNIQNIEQILQEIGYKTRDLSGTAIKQLARLNWDKFVGKNVGLSAGGADLRIAKARIEENVDRGNDLLLRQGLTQEQIDKMDDETWSKLTLAAYREENAEQTALEEKQQRETEEALEQLDIDDIPFQDVYLQDEYFDVAEENARLDEVNPEYTGETIEVNGVERTVYNSNGDRIAKSEPALRNFWNWFGDSKVVDDKGRPWVVWHGTKSEFKIFRESMTGKYGRGIYLTPNEFTAQNYGNIKMPLYAKIENPFLVEDMVYDFTDGEVVVKALQEYFGDEVIIPDNIKNEILESESPIYTALIQYRSAKKGDLTNKIARMSGYDGIFSSTGKLEDNIEIVAFEPNQIKSTQNRGTFSEKNPNIYFQNRQSGKGGAYDARTRSITLGAKADATTLPHELAHYWIDKNFKYARSGRASQVWQNAWKQVEKYLGIDPEDKVLDKAASEKFARAYERFLAEEKLPLVLMKSVADFRDFVLDHYDFDLDEARGLQDKFGLPIQMTDEIRQWFNKSWYENYVDPAESLTIDVRVEQENERSQVARRVEMRYEDVQDEAKTNNIVNEMPSGTQIQEEAGIKNDRIIGGGAIKESQGAIGQKIGATYESTGWQIQEDMVDKYLKSVSLDEAIESLDDDTYPDKIDPDFLRGRLIEILTEQGREDEAARLVMETRETLTEAAQTLQAARRLNTPYAAAINTIVQQKTEKLARAKYGNNKKAVSKLDTAIDRLIDKYESMYLEAKDDTERAIVYDTMMNEAARTIGTLNKNPDVLFQDDQQQDIKTMKQLRKRGSVKAYRSRAKALLKQKLGLAPSRQQLRELARLTADVNKVITQYRKDVRDNKAPVIDPTEVLNAQNALNNYMAAQVGNSKLAQFADATNSFMMANMLWNPATQFKNIVGNSVQMIPHLLGSVAKYRNTGTVSMQKKLEIIKNAVKVQATTGYNVFSLTDFFDRKTLWAEKYYEPTTVVGKAIRAPLTLLGLSDTMFKGFVFLNHADIMATHMARSEGAEQGWTKQQIDERATELFYQALNTDPRTITLAGQKIRSEALVEGEETTFTQDSKTAHFANQFRNMLNFGKKTGVGNLLIPFTSTIANIAQDAVANWTFGTIKEAIKNPKQVFEAINPMIDKESRKAAWKTIAPEYKNLIKNVMGILLLVYIAATMGDDDEFVLDYNLQTEKDKDIRQNRNAPYGTSVRIGDKWVQIDFLSGAYLPLQTYLTARRNNFTADGWLQGLFGWRDLMPGVGEMESLLKDYQNSLKYNKDSDAVAVGELLADQGTEILTRLIPMGALANQIGNITDETKREKYNRWYDRILGRLPWARETLPESTSRTTGKAIKQTDTWWNLLSGGNVKDYVEASVADEARYEFIDADKALRFNEANSKLKELGKDTQRYKNAVKEVRSLYNQKLAQLSQHPTYKKWDIEQKRKAAVDLHTDVVNAVATKYGIKKKKPLKKKQKQPKLV